MENDDYNKVTERLLHDMPTGVLEALNDVADVEKTNICGYSNKGVTKTLACAPCNSKHKQSIAVLFCPECDNTLLCDDCSEIHKSMKSTRSHALVESDMYHKTKTIKALLCDPCATRNIIVDAKYACEECNNELLCEDCSCNHKYIKSTRSHVLLEVEKFTKKTKQELMFWFCEPCGTRNSKVVAKYFCKNCENELFCDGCSDNHRSMKSTRTHVLVEAEKYTEVMKTELLLCDPCGSRKIKVVAKYVCEECGDEFLCEGCSESHTSMKSTRSHFLIETEKYKEKTKHEAMYCDPCGNRNIKVVAKFFCKECEDELLCEGCSVNHRSMKSTRSHVLIEAEKYKENTKQETMFCDPCGARNIKVVVKYVCEECENELLCKDCSENHKSMKSTRSHVLMEVEKYKDKIKRELLFCDPCGTRSIKVVAKYFCQECENELLCECCSDAHRSMKSTRSHILIEAAKYIEKTKRELMFCDPCGTRNIKLVAKFVCEECENELLCEGCSENHKSMKSTRSHVLLEVEKYTEKKKQELLFCDPCGTRDIREVAKYVCEKCENELLCEGCSENHKSMKSTRNHVLIQVEKYTEKTKQELLFCDPCGTRHIKEVAKYVCEECENELLCEGCYDNHKSMKSTRKHILIEVTEYVDNTKQGSYSCDPCSHTLKDANIQAKVMKQDENLLESNGVRIQTAQLK
ncbi:hypothetical protein DPMN_130585 [Dreissena polymorpha]|uniref:B box-type domain-containing protein n=3 Tax=Dreissena polymorpha TaxID=45954 RepID=A0A9D4K1W1_DREPO|nr:hypothetical protein DPMN_130585 [Dreissena polymorpha]